jgi:hypothetical protein
MSNLKTNYCPADGPELRGRADRYESPLFPWIPIATLATVAVAITAIIIYATSPKHDGCELVTPRGSTIRTCTTNGNVETCTERTVERNVWECP